MTKAFWLSFVCIQSSFYFPRIVKCTGTWVWVKALHHLFISVYSSDAYNARWYILSSRILPDNDCIVLFRFGFYGAIWAMSCCCLMGLLFGSLLIPIFIRSAFSFKLESLEIMTWGFCLLVENELYGLYKIIRPGN